jgi:hypothetical protein
MSMRTGLSSASALPSHSFAPAPRELSPASSGPRITSRLGPAAPRPDGRAFPEKSLLADSGAFGRRADTPQSSSHPATSPPAQEYSRDTPCRRSQTVQAGSRSVEHGFSIGEYKAKISTGLRQASTAWAVPPRWYMDPPSRRGAVILRNVGTWILIWLHLWTSGIVPEFLLATWALAGINPEPMRLICGRRRLA